MKNLKLNEIIRPHKYGVVLMTMLLIIVSACRVTFVPDYSESIEKQIIATQKMNEKLYSDMLATAVANRDYENFEKAYAEIESNINSLVFQMQAREKNTDFVAMTDILKKKFIAYKNEHKGLKEKGKKLSNSEIETYSDFMKAFYTPMLVAEKALSRTKNK